MKCSSGILSSHVAVKRKERPAPGPPVLIDNLNNGNINVIQDVGGKLVRITLDPSGQRIISAGLVRANQITNGIANGRFVPK